MNKDLHDIDDLFRSGLKAYEVTPSVGVKERLNAALDKKDATAFNRAYHLRNRLFEKRLRRDGQKDFG